MNLIIVSGAEATCKSTIGRELAERLSFTYQSKDSIKESLFDSEHENTWNFRWYEAKAKEAFFADIEVMILKDQDAIIESNFIGEDKARLKRLVASNVQLGELHCYTRGLISFKRFVRRNETKARHPGHHDRRWYPKILFQTIMHNVGIEIGAHKPVKLSNNVLLLNTTDFPNIDNEGLASFIKQSKL